MYDSPDQAYESQSLLMRILVRRFVYRHHPKAWGGLCLAAGLVVLILGGLVCSAGYWWGAAIIAAAALELWIGYRLLGTVQIANG